MLARSGHNPHRSNVHCNAGKADSCRVGQNCIYAPYMTVNLVIALPKIPYLHRI